MKFRTRSPHACGARSLRRSGIPPAVLAIAALLVGCGSSSRSSSSSTTTTANLNTTLVARSIEKSIFTQRHLRSHVTCPDLVKQEQGRTFECVATGRNAKHKATSTPFLVTIQNNRGYATYVGK